MTTPYLLADLNAKGAPTLVSDGDTPETWKAKEARLRAVWADYLGEMPGRHTPARWKVRSETKEADHVRQHIAYETGEGEEVPAYLLIPNGAKGRRLPAVLALHPTVAEGKDDVATETGRPGRRYGLELVRRGFVVLAPDTITAGERVYPGVEAYRTAPFYERHPEATAVGKMLHDHRQGVDLLCELEFVNPARIGAIGHSLGAYNAFFLATLDPRVRAFVASCGFCTFAGDPQPNRWGQRDWFSHFPRLTADLERASVPFEFHEIAALAATGAAGFFSLGQRDRIFPNWRESAAALLELDALYRLLGREDDLVCLVGNFAHDFPEHVRDAAYAFLERKLGGAGLAD